MHEVEPAPEIIVQVPSAVAPSALAQASHAPVHALLQQTSFAQNPVVHWSLAVQPPACADFATHTCEALQ